MTVNAPTNETREHLEAEHAVPAAGARSQLLARAHAYRLPLAMTVLNLAGIVSLVALVGFHGVSRVDVAIFLVMYFLGMLGLEVGMHRHFAHRAFAARPPLRLALAVLGAMGGQGSALLWATNHRKHHRFSDREGDPHSPSSRGTGLVGRLRGLWHGHFAWHFRVSAIDVHDLYRYARDLTTDRALMRVDRHPWWWLGLGLLAPAVFGLAITGTVDGTVTAFLWGGPIRILLVDQVVWAVNSIAHSFGARPFAARDQSTNVAWLAALSLGAGWHNTHHAFPASARTALLRGQLDPGYWCIRAFAALGLADAVQVASHRPDDREAPTT